MRPRLLVSVTRQHDPSGQRLLNEALELLADALAERAIGCAQDRCRRQGYRPTNAKHREPARLHVDLDMKT